MKPQTGTIEERSAPSEAAPRVEGNSLIGWIPFGVESRDFGGWSEVIAPGAFANADRADLVCTLQHDLSRVLGRHPGTLEIEERADGIEWSVDLPAGPLGQDVKESVKRGDLRATSWRMRVGKDRWEGTRRIVEEVRSWLDVALVANPSYPAAAAEIRSAPEGAEGDVMKVEDRSTGGTPKGGGLKVEERTAGGDASTPESRVMDAMAGVPKGEMRDLTHASAAEVEPDDVRTVLLDRLRPASVMLQTGIPSIVTDRKALHWPTLSGDMTATWLNELEDIPESDPDFDTWSVTVKALKALVRTSAEAMEDSDPDLMSLLLSHVDLILAAKFDNELLVGNDAKGITGLLNLSGTQTLTSQTTLANWDDIIKATAMLAEQQIPGPYAVLMHPRVFAGYSLLKELTSGSNMSLAQPEAVPDIYVTSKLPITGSSPNFKTTTVVFAPAQCLVVWRRSAVVEVDRSEEFSSDAVLVRGKLRAGFGVRFPQSVVKIGTVPAPVIS